MLEVLQESLIAFLVFVLPIIIFYFWCEDYEEKQRCHRIIRKQKMTIDRLNAELRSNSEVKAH